MSLARANDLLQRGRRSASVAWLLATREWLADYRQSRLSALWPLAHPIVYSALFVLLRPVIGASGKSLLPFAIFVFIGFCFWQTWIDVLRSQMNAIRRHKGLMKRGELGAGTLMLATTFSGAIQLLPRLLVAAVAAAWALDASPLVVLGLCGLGVVVLLNGSVIGALLQPFATLAPDMDRVIQGISLALLMTGAVFLQLPRQPSVLLELLVTINPLGSLLNAARAPVFGELPVNWAGPVCWILVTIAIAVYLPFLGRRLLPIVIERMGN